MDLDITEVARRSGLPASTLRFYEEKGLIASVGRRGLHRTFDPDVLERLALVALGRTAGFPLDEIARMFAPDGRPRIDRARVTARADELDRTIRRMAALSEVLRHVAACSAPSHMECPTFQRMVREAAAERTRPPSRARLPPRRRSRRGEPGAVRPAPGGRGAGEGRRSARPPIHHSHPR